MWVLKILHLEHRKDSFEYSLAGIYMSVTPWSVSDCDSVSYSHETSQVCPRDQAEFEDGCGLKSHWGVRFSSSPFSYICKI